MHLIELFWMLRFPVLIAAFLLFFPTLALKKARPLLAGLLDLRPRQAVPVTVAACIGAWSCMLCFWAIAREGPERIGAAIEMPSWFAVRIHGLSWQPVFWSLFALSCLLPLRLLLAARKYSLQERIDPPRDFSLRFVAAIAVGYSVAGGLAAVCLLLYKHPSWFLLGRAAGIAHAANRQAAIRFPWLRGVERSAWLAGYFDPHFHRLYSAHLLCLLALLLSLAVYFLFGMVHYRWPKLFTYTPALCYLLLLAIWSCWILCGLSFFFDALRVPVGLILVLYLWKFSGFHSDHTYRLVPSPQAPGAIAPPGALAALAAGASGRVIVAATTGGGIQSSAWTAKVLAELSAHWSAAHPKDPHRFARALRAISSVSGGSVGAALVTAAYDDDGSLDQQKTLVGRAMASSLAHVAAALAYGDFLRALTPFRWKCFPGRGTALENAFIARTPRLSESLSSWWAAVAEGRRPANLFNATLCETGSRFLMGSSALKEPVEGLSQFDTDYPGYDLTVAAAARLSATFPFVTPASAPQSESGTIVGKRYHVVDGGYYDNYGIATLAEWVRQALQEQRAPSHAGRKITEVLLLQLRGFPSGAAAQPATIRTWLYQLWSPLQTMLSVRDCGQLANSNLDVELLAQACQSAGATLHPVVLQFPAVSGPASSYPPLSWHMTERQKRAIGDAWTLLEQSQGDEIDKVRRFLEGE